MEAIVNVALPIFGIIALGFLSGRIRLLGGESAEALNRFVFFIALPPAMFIFTARAEIDQILNWRYMGAYLVAMVLTIAPALVAARLVFRVDGQRAAFHGFISIFANLGYMGIPIFLTAFGPDGVLPPIVTGLVGGIPAMMFIMITLEAMQARAGIAGILGGLWRIVARNPLFIATGLGILWSYAALPVPVAAGNMLDMLAMTAGPAALFALGLSLTGHPIRGDLAEIAWLAFLKLIVHPGVTWLVVTQVFALDPFWTASAVLLAAMPLGPTAFVLAQQYGVATRVTSAAVAVSTTCSIVTLSLVLVFYGIG